MAVKGLMENVWEFSGKKSRENWQLAEKWQDRKRKALGRKTREETGKGNLILYLHILVKLATKEINNVCHLESIIPAAVNPVNPVLFLVLNKF